MMKQFYILHIKRHYNDGSDYKHTYVYRTFVEAIDDFRRNIVAEESVTNWYDNNGVDLMVSVFGTGDDYTVDIDIECGFMKEEP